MDRINWELVFLYMTYGAIAIFGALASYLHRLSNGLEFSFLSLTANMFVSSFSALIMFLICSYFNLDPLLTSGICGISGWSGVKIIEEIEAKLINRVKDGGLK